MSDKTPKFDRQSRAIVRRIAKDYVRPYKWMFAFAFLCMAIAAASTAAMAAIMEPVVNRMFGGIKSEFLYQTIALVVAMFVARGIASLGQHVAINWAGQRVIADLQAEFYGHLIRADLNYFHNNPTGSLISRLTYDIVRLRYTVSDALTGVGLHFFTVCFLVAVMIYQDWLLALIALGALPIVVGPIIMIGRRMRKVSEIGQIEAGRLTTVFDETFRGIRHVKAYGMEAYETGRTTDLINHLFRIYFRGFRTEALSYPVIDFLAAVTIAMVMVYGAHQINDNSQAPGGFVAFVAAAMLAYEPLKRLSLLNAKIQEGLACAERVFDALDVEPAIVEKPDAKPLTVTKGEVRLDGVRFAYHEGAPALEDVSLVVPAGKTVALVGLSGAGKSTIMNLIPRFYDVDDGRVTIDGVDVRDVTLASLRANIGLVSQEISLFDDTIRANIAYGRADAGDEEIVAAAKQAAAHVFIEMLAQGYDTQVGGDGVKLSGGQRQRIAIARAMLKSAPILLLDEATSALDSESERQVQAALNTLMAGRTTLMIAHRLSTVFDADLICVIDRGRVAESGTHDALIARDGIYSKLYAMQLAETKTEDRSGDGDAPWDDAAGAVLPLRKP
ncbi:MAG TPA: ABC transporter transmembrane domain-containing protein [Alphaproteobacteria bacterium]|nr:ABC transporter transmembrane domain-containing protein [Alphaproteobacteria bacterium]